ncbi:MAG: HU family DNA-binding protein [Proteobacteria bacterium]|nr:HU family DNA-binding protein [Pseudomonadota bacterium]
MATEIADAETAVDVKVADPNMIKKKDIYDYVSVSTGLRKRDVREAVDSMLEFLHSSLSDGKTVQVPPLGKIKPVERGSGDNIKMHYKLMLKKTDDAEKKSG